MEEKKLIMICITFIIVVLVSCVTFATFVTQSNFQTNTMKGNITHENIIEENTTDTYDYNTTNPDDITTNSNEEITNPNNNIGNNNKKINTNKKSSNNDIEYLYSDKNGKIINPRIYKSNPNGNVPPDSSSEPVTIVRHDYSGVEMNPINQKHWAERRASGKGYV